MASNSPGGEDCPLLCARGWGIERQVRKPPACAWWGGDMITRKNLNNALYCITTPALTSFHASLFISHPPHFLVPPSLCLCIPHSGPRLFLTAKRDKSISNSSFLRKVTLILSFF